MWAGKSTPPTSPQRLNDPQTCINFIALDHLAASQEDLGTEFKIDGIFRKLSADSNTLPKLWVHYWLGVI